MRQLSASMAVDPDLIWLGNLMGAEQVFSDRGLVAMLCPDLEGKTLAELTPTEFERLMEAAQSYSLSKLKEEEED